MIRGKSLGGDLKHASYPVESVFAIFLRPSYIIFTDKQTLYFKEFTLETILIYVLRLMSPYVMKYWDGVSNYNFLTLLKLLIHRPSKMVTTSCLWIFLCLFGRYQHVASFHPIVSKFSSEVCMSSG